MSKPVVNVMVVANMFSDRELRFMSSVLNSQKGYGKIARFRLISDIRRNYFKDMPQGQARIVVFGKFRGDQIRAVFPDYEHIHKMSFTFMDVNPPVIVFNHENWNGPPKAYDLSLRRKSPKLSAAERLRRYRVYLVNHEFGHAMGLGHDAATDLVCPVMYQHTRGIERCQQDLPWPSTRDLRSASRFLLENLIN